MMHLPLIVIVSVVTPMGRVAIFYSMCDLTRRSVDRLEVDQTEDTSCHAACRDTSKGRPIVLLSTSSRGRRVSQLQSELTLSHTMQMV